MDYIESEDVLRFDVTMDYWIVVHVIYRAKDLEDYAVDSWLGKRLALCLRLQVASRKQLKYEIHSLLIIKETVKRCSVYMVEIVLDFDLSH